MVIQARDFRSLFAVPCARLNTGNGQRKRRLRELRPQKQRNKTKTQTQSNTRLKTANWLPRPENSDFILRHLAPASARGMASASDECASGKNNPQNRRNNQSQSNSWLQRQSGYPGQRILVSFCGTLRPPQHGEWLAQATKARVENKNQENGQNWQSPSSSW